MPQLQCRFSLVRACGAAVFALWLSCAHAVELGDATVRSYIGQPLVADIELTSMADPAQPVQVRMASRDVYRGANVAMPAILSTLSMSTLRRDGRQFLHITSTRAVEAEYLLLFLDLSQGARSNVRQVTLWLTPDPRPAPPPAPVPMPVAPPLAVAAPVPVPASAPASAPAAAPAVLAQASARAAPAPAPTPVPAKSAAAARAPALPTRAPVAAPATCNQQFTTEQIKTCAAIDYKNGLLSAQIVELEEKVKVLQLAIEGRAERAPATPPAASTKAAPPAVPPIAVKPAKAHKKKSGLPWLWIGVGVGALLLIAGAVLFVLKRKRRAARPQTAPAPKTSLLAGLKSRFKRSPKGAKAPAATPEAEPVTEG